MATVIPEHIRVALIGKTGAGKSAFGNTLLGYRRYESKPAGESVTKTCEVATGFLSSGQAIKVVDTPGIMDTSRVDVKDEVAKSIAYLSPGPHAFLIVLQPNRDTAEEQQTLKELENLFGDASFLQYTIIVMVRKNEIENNDEPIEIHKFMEIMASPSVKSLYEKCGRRAVAVENKGTPEEKKQYAEEVIQEVLKLGGYFSHAHFEMVKQNKILQEQLLKQQQELDRQAREQEKREREKEDRERRQQEQNRELERQKELLEAEQRKKIDLQTMEIQELKKMIQQQQQQQQSSKPADSGCSVM